MADDVRVLPRERRLAPRQRLRDRDTLIGSSPRELRRRFGVEMKTCASWTSKDGRCASPTEARSTSTPSSGRPDTAPNTPGSTCRHRGGRRDPPPPRRDRDSGLYFLGLTWQYTRGSALIGWVKDDAEFISKQIAGLAEERHTSPRSRAGREGVNAGSRTPRRTRIVPHRHEGPAEATRPEVVELRDGDEFELEIAPVAKRIGDATVRMLAYNGSIPGPTLKLPQGAHGDRSRHEPRRPRGDRPLARPAPREPLRRNARDAGADPRRRDVHATEITFPDPGAYWYHPHIREDYGQEMGLYGNILVGPPTPTTGRRRNRELLLTLDDILIEDGKVAPFSRTETTHVAMGRFGNVMLVAGEPDLALDAPARRGRPPLPDEHREHARLQRRASPARG